MTFGKGKIIVQGLGLVGGLLLAALVAGGVIGYLEASGVSIDVGGAAFLILAVIAVALMGGSIWVGAVWMRSIDEAAREAHKAAWYWGGSSGMAAGGVLMILATLPGAQGLILPSFLFGRTDPAAYAATGAFAMISLMLIGYIIAWAWWWLARR